VVVLKENIVMLVLCRRVIAKLLIEHIKNNTTMDAFDLYEYDKAKRMAMVRQPALALVEIPERYDDPALDALDVCKDIKEACPNCKVMLMCPEHDKKSVNTCIDAKKKGKIEDYIFYDSSPEYLTSKLEALLPE